MTDKTTDEDIEAIVSMLNHMPVSDDTPKVTREACAMFVETGGFPNKEQYIGFLRRLDRAVLPATKQEIKSFVDRVMRIGEE
jgi:hypothetical protein